MSHEKGRHLRDKVTSDKLHEKSLEHYLTKLHLILTKVL